MSFHRENRRRGNRGAPRNPEGLASSAKERECLEAVENGKTSDEELARRFPALMIARTKALVKMACDPEHRSCLRAQAFIRKVKWRPDASDGQDKDGIQITVTHGRLDVPMPGMPGAPIEDDDEPTASLPESGETRP